MLQDVKLIICKLHLQCVLTLYKVFFMELYLKNMGVK